jgi:hypothetical protein
MRRALATTTVALVALLALAPAASAAFNLLPPEVSSETEAGADELRAGIHPYALTTKIEVETEFDPDAGKEVPTGEVKDMVIDFPAGLVGNPTAVDQCSTPDFLAGKQGECSNDAAVGVVEIEFGEPGKISLAPLYNLEPTVGSAAKVGFIVEDRAPVTIDIGLNPNSPSNVIANSTNVSQAVFFYRARVTVWGNPADDSHDAERGKCALDTGPPGPCPFEGSDEIAFLTLPSSCEDPLAFDFKVDSWGEQGIFDTESASAGTPTECDAVEFKPEIAAAPTTPAASSPSGLDFSIGFDDQGLIDPDGRAQATIKKAVVTLPEGMTLNPGAATGLDSCSQAAFEAESLQSMKTGPLCPAASKVGEVEVETPLLEQTQQGSIYVATPYKNPFGTLLALYMVIRNPELGILVKLPGKITTSPSGRLTTTFGEAPYAVPQVPFSDFRFEFRSGPRAPLTTPPGCGPHTITAVFTPSSGKPAIVKTASFATTTGPGGTPCISGLPFSPSFQAGSQSSVAGAFSPFYMHLTRPAGQQDLTALSAILPPGLTGKIAGVERCSQAALAAAAAKTGTAELALPSCPAGSRLGSITSGAGSGDALTYVAGSLHLAGPYQGSPLSIAAVVPAVAGPFDLGTVVVQQGLDLNPTTGIAEVKGSPGSIPRFLQGIPLALRDVRVAVDRPGFTLNPTNCEPLATKASLLGSAGTVATPEARYQASGCKALGFKPKLVISMKGKTKRTGNPAVTAVMTPRPGDANIAGATVLLPPTMFIDNAHINNPCTRVQFNAEQCPKGSILGTAVAKTPLLAEPLKGNVYFRSNGGERKLPDIVADLRGQFRIILVGFVDSKNGRTRTRFLGVPDAPVSKFTLKLAGGKRGLLENSVDICAKKQIAKVVLGAQNGRRLAKDQAIQVKCGKGKGKGGNKGGGKKR